MKKSNEKLHGVYTDKVTTAKKALARFTETLTESVNPAHDFEWADKHFMDAARVEVYGMLAAYLEEDKATYTDLKELVLDRVLNGAKYPEESTSGSSNKVSRYRLAVFATVYNDLQYWYTEPEVQDEAEMEAIEAEVNAAEQADRDAADEGQWGRNV